ncbi:MAG: glycosyltransferase [Vicinamibacterales bacterium]
MRIVLSFATAVDWHEGHPLARALRAAGHVVRIVDVTPARGSTSVDGVEPFEAGVPLDEVLRDGELFFYIEPGGLVPRRLERAPCRTVCALADVNVSLAPRLDLSLLFDDVLIYRFGFAQHFAEHEPGHVRTFPLAIDPALFHPPGEGEVRDLDVAFHGQRHGVWSTRAPFLDRLRTRYRMNDPGEWLPPAGVAETYRRARIVVNPTVLDGLNPRIFEAMACGALLMTSHDASGVERLFDDGVHLVRFGDPDDLEARVAYYLAHEAERRRIADAGCHEVLAKHTWAVRERELFGGAGGAAPLTPLPGAAPARRLSRRDVNGIYRRIYKQQGHARALARSGAWGAAARTLVRTRFAR